MLTLLSHRTSYCCHTSPSTLKDNEVSTMLGNSVAQHPNIWHKSLVIITSIQLESWILNSETVGVQDKISMQIIIVNPKHCVSHILKACFSGIQHLLNKQSLISKEKSHSVCNKTSTSVWLIASMICLRGPTTKPGLVVHIYNPSLQEAEVGKGLWTRLAWVTKWNHLISQKQTKQPNEKPTKCVCMCICITEIREWTVEKIVFVYVFLYAYSYFYKNCLKEYQ